MRLDDRSQCLTELAFDRWFAREELLEHSGRVEDHLLVCTRCRVRGELMQRERAAFLAKAPTIAANTALARKSLQARRAGGRARDRGTRAWFAWPAAAMAAAIAAVLMWHAPPQTERRKGGSEVAFYVKRGARVARGASGDTVYPGDLLRFTYSNAAPAYLALLGRDRRSASVYFPAADQAERVAAGRDQALDFSLELDGELGEERLYVVLCPAEYALAPLREELEKSGELRARAGCRLERIALRKEAPP